MKEVIKNLTANEIAVLKSLRGTRLMSYLRSKILFEDPGTFTFETVGLVTEQTNVEIACRCEYDKATDLEVGTFHVTDYARGKIPSPFEEPLTEYPINEVIKSVEIITERVCMKSVKEDDSCMLSHHIGIVLIMETKKLMIIKNSYWSDMVLTYLVDLDFPMPSFENEWEDNDEETFTVTSERITV